MIKNKFDYKLVNTAIVILIIYLMYHTGNLWIGIFAKTGKILFPFFLAFVLAYALYPFLKWMIKNKIPKSIGVIIIIAIFFAVIAILTSMVAPLLVDQTGLLFDSILKFLSELSNKYSLDVDYLKKFLDNGFNNIISSMSSYISNGAVKVINTSLEYISTAFITFSATIYFLIDMENIRGFVKKTLKKKSKKMFKYVSIIDKEMKSYLTGMIKVMGITLIEYSLAYKLIGHPNAILLGVLATVGGLIPYFGGIMTNIVAAITAFVVSPALFVRTVITFVVLSALDGYLINPWVYGKTNNVHPLIVIFSVFAGGILFGILGIMISFPVAAIIISTYKFFKDDISEKIIDIKESKKEEQ